MDTILTILKYVAIGIGVIIAIPITIVLVGIVLAILGAIIEFLGFVLLVIFAFLASLLNAFLDLFFTPKKPRN